MQALSLERSNPAQTAVVSLASVAAVALLGLVMAYWTWEWMAPRAEPRAPAAAQTGGSASGKTQDAYGLFGGGKRQPNGTSPSGAAVRLLGVVAASGNRPGYAVLRLDAKLTVAVLEGAAIEPGVRLAEVHARGVVLERNGIRETLALPERSAPVAAVAPLSSR